MKLRTQFIITMLLFGITLAVIAASAIITNRQVEKTGRQERIAAHIAQGASELSYLANDYLIYREGQQLNRWQSRFASFSAEVAALRVDLPEQRALVADIKTNRERFKEVFDNSASALESPSGNLRSPLDPAFFQVSWSRMAVQSQGLAADASRLSQLLHQQIDGLTQKRTLLVYVMVALFGLFLIVSYMLTYRRILNSIVTLRAGTAVIGSGNLDFVLEEKRQDEIGELSQAFNRMTADLKEVTASKADLEREITERKQAEEDLRKAHAELEVRVQERTAELARTTEMLRDLSSKLLSTQEEERKRIAGEIHDTLGAGLVAIKFKVENAQQQMGKVFGAAAESLNIILPVIQESIDECRRIQQDLRPSMLDDLGLLPTLSWFCRRYQTIFTGIIVKLEQTVEERDLLDSLKIVIFRVTQEGLNNIAKHSQADLVHLSLGKMDGRIELVLEDNGRGFDLTKVLASKSTKRGLGLTSMRERTELSGGSFVIESTEGKGTTLRASWPI